MLIFSDGEAAQKSIYTFIYRLNVPLFEAETAHTKNFVLVIRLVKVKGPSSLS